MIAALQVEAFKLNRSLAGLLALAAPCLIPIYTFFSVVRSTRPLAWDGVAEGGLAIWAFFMLPMSAVALCTLVAQVEHAPRSWDYLRALPVRRWTLYAAKLVCVLGLLAMMSATTFVLTLLAARIGLALNPEAGLSDLLDVEGKVLLLGKIYAASLLLVTIQLWAALRFSGVVPSLALGIGGVFFSTVATSAEEGVFFPWQMPVNMLASEAWRSETALALGLGGGLLAAILAIAHLARRDVV